jgi:hypothetical protein
VEGGGKALMAFMSACLDGSKMYRSGVQEKFFAKYFNFTLTDKGSTGYSMSDVSSNPVVAGEQKKSEKVYEFREVDISRDVIQDGLGNGSVIRRGEGDEWTYFEVFKKESGNFTMLVYSDYPYRYPLKGNIKPGGDEIKTDHKNAKEIEVYSYEGKITDITDGKLENKEGEKVEFNIAEGKFQVLYDDKVIFTIRAVRYKDVETKVKEFNF